MTETIASRNKRPENQAEARPRIEPLEGRVLLTGSMSDVYEYPGSTGSAWANEIVAVGEDLYTAGTATDASGKQHGVIRKRAAGTTRWQTIHDYQMNPGSHTSFRGLDIAPDGTIYVTGSALDPVANHWVWFVEAKGPDQAEWERKDTFQLVQNEDSHPHDIEIETNVTNSTKYDVYVVGSGFDGTSIKRVGGPTNHWVVRKSTAGGTFETIDNYLAQQTASATSLAVVRSHVYVVGLHGAEANRTWITRRSINGGTSWQMVDTPDPTQASVPRNIVADAAGNVFVAGIAQRSNGLKGKNALVKNYWVVRQSSAFGALGTFQTVDDYRDNDTGSRALAVTLDGNGNVFVGGFAGAGVGIIRGRPVSGGVWSEVDRWQEPNSSSTEDMDMVLTADGTVYTAGQFYDGQSHWFVRQTPSAAASIIVAPSVASTDEPATLGTALEVLA
jgi:hypothetical protein